MKSEAMKAFPKPLTCEEEDYYIEEVMRGSKKAREILILHNLRLVTHVLKKYMLSEAEQEEFISIGIIGLIKSIDSFKPDKGIRLATYATRCIDNEILMTLRANKKLQREVFLSDPIGQDKEGNEIKLLDVLVSDASEPGSDIIFNEELEFLKNACENILSPRELEIVRLRYGMYGREFTQIEIADMFLISRSYVSRIEKKALEKLKKYFEKYQL